MLADVQGSPDGCGIPLDEVGVDGLRYPVLINSPTEGKREVIATVSMAVTLDGATRGAHLSRFIEVLHEHCSELNPASVCALASEVRHRLDADSSTIRFTFPYMLTRLAPVTRLPSFIAYRCELIASATPAARTAAIGTAVAVTSVCPCSKAISDHGAHNQRGTVNIVVQLRELDCDLWFDDLIAIAKSSGSAPVYALLKRPDERHVTMSAYDTPVFVEDMARTAAQRFEADPRAAAFRVRVVNDESIHNHAAYASVASRQLPKAHGGLIHV